jgi:hypothetical protein
MTQSKQSNTNGIPLEVVAFMAAFCRQDLSTSDIEMINEVFTQLTNEQDYYLKSPLERFRDIMRLAPQSVVEFAPQGTVSELNNVGPTQLTRADVSLARKCQRFFKVIALKGANSKKIYTIHELDKQ